MKLARNFPDDSSAMTPLCRSWALRDNVGFWACHGSVEGQDWNAYRTVSLIWKRSLLDDKIQGFQHLG
jgi:hypothetical protein